MPLGFRLLEKVPFAPALSLLFGTAAAILVMATPDWMFDRLVIESGISTFFPFLIPPFDKPVKVLAALAALWLVAGLLWPIFALIGAMLSPRPQKTKGHRIEASFEAPVAAMDFESLLRGSVADNADPARVSPAKPAGKSVCDGIAPGAPSLQPSVEQTTRGLRATRKDKGLSDNEAGHLASDAVANQSIEPRKHKAEKTSQTRNEAVDSSETRH